MNKISLQRNKRFTMLVSMILVVLIAGAGVCYFATRTKKSSINLAIPSSTAIDQTITVPLRISVDKAINAAEFDFIFPTDLLQVKEIKTEGSFFALWIKDSPGYSNDKGTIYLAGGLPTPGFVGQNGLVATVIFTTKHKGTGKITLDPKSRVLLNDGLGTQLAVPYQPITFTVK